MDQPSSSSINQLPYDENDELDTKPFAPLREIGSTSEEEETMTMATISQFRTTFPQVLATMAQSLLLLSLGMMLSSTTVVIGALRKSTTESFSIDDSQASWFAGILLICQPIGSILSGILQEWLGRKKCMLLVNVPELIGWYLIFSSKNVIHLYIAASLMGLSIGFMEAPTLSYVGEISQPHLRGTLASLTSTYISVGFFTMYMLGTMTKWRTAIGVSCAAPVITFLAILMIPESPIWLIKKNRLKDAEKAMCWLRGWVPSQYVSKELEAMRCYYESSKLYVSSTLINDDVRAGESNSGLVAHQSKIIATCKDLTRSEMMRPFRLVVTYFFFSHCASLSGSRPYLVQIFKSLNLPVGAHMMTVLSAILQLLGGFACMVLIHRIGKRKLSLISMASCTTLSLCLGVYTYQLKYSYIVQPWIPCLLFCGIFFCTNLGINPIPWSLLSEVFPSRGRGIGGGVSAAMNYVEFFVVSKTFLDLQTLLNLPGVFFFYGILGFVGIFFIYFQLPETEGKKLEDVEKIFSRQNPIR